MTSVELVLELPDLATELLLHRNSSACASILPGVAGADIARGSGEAVQLVVLRVQSFPCDVRLCVKPLQGTACVDDSVGRSE